MAGTKPNALRVLVADDETNIVASYAQIFSLEGHDVRCAYSGEEALDMVPGFLPHVLIADVGLGGMDGVQLAILTAEMIPDCTIFLFSGQGDTVELDGRGGRSERRFRIHPKPVPPRVLVELLRAEALRRDVVAPPVKRSPSGEPLLMMSAAKSR